MSDREVINLMDECKRRKFYIEKYYNDIYLRVEEYNKKYNITNYSELLYNYVNNLGGYCKCKQCDNNTKFISYTKGYRVYCSSKCSNNDIEIIKLNREKYVNTCLKKYGVENTMLVKEVREKSKKTNLEKYGVENYVQSIEFKEKLKSSNLEKYGVEHYQQSDDFKEKSKQTNLEKYGVEHHTKTDEYKEKMRILNLEKYGVDHHTKTDEYKEKYKEYLKSDDFLNTREKIKQSKRNSIIEMYKNYNDDYEFISINGQELCLKCLKCNREFIISKQLYYLRTKANSVCCTFCSPKNGSNISKGEKEVLEYIKSIYDGDIYENFVIDNYEIDIYLPSLGFGIEYNGLYWHSEFNKPKNYHLDKKNFFKSKSISIFNIWEDDWMYKTDILKSMISNKIGKTEYKIYARKCKISPVSNSEYKKFLEDNHLQGYVPSKVKIGLFYNNELVSLITFGGLRKSLGQNSIEGYWELLRFCNKIGYSVIGGTSKLMKHFINEYSPKQIISYCDNSRSDGNLYRKIGFEYAGETPINYYWCKKYIKHSRFSFRKDVLVKNGSDPNKTEVEIMHDMKYYRVYDCGSIKFIMYLS